ncbi:MAG: TetR/AcrR family transcriptional regulator [Bacteroidaceae bacterium]|nr:TetR/AcrR family transcriptional regulator [Bacteroidaceae bacterium]
MSVSKTRQKLLEVARDLFASKGIDATTMNDIALASQKGRRTLYTYFRNKEEIFLAVIEGELDHLSEEMDKVISLPIAPDRKIVNLIYAHLNMISEVVKRNGSLRAEFFRDINLVERARKKFDQEEISVIRTILKEGIALNVFDIEHINLTADVIHYAVKGIEIPFMFDRLGEGLTMEESVEVVERLIQRILGVKKTTTNN